MNSSDVFLIKGFTVDVVHSRKQHTRKQHIGKQYSSRQHTSKQLTSKGSVHYLGRQVNN